MELIDEYRLLFTLEAKDGESVLLVMTDTRNSTEARTTFLLPYTGNGACLSLELDKDTHTRPYNESKPSFYDDPNQRLIVLSPANKHKYSRLVFRVEALFKHHEDGKDSRIEWDTWRESVAAPSGLRHNLPVTTWVSGCRFFAVLWGSPGPEMRVYDFSEKGRRCPGGEIDQCSRVRCLERAGAKVLPLDVVRARGTRDSIMLFTSVRTIVHIRFSFGIRLTSIFLFGRKVPGQFGRFDHLRAYFGSHLERAPVWKDE